MQMIKQFGSPILILVGGLSLVALEVHAPGMVPRPVSVIIGMMLFLWWAVGYTMAVQDYLKR